MKLLLAVLCALTVSAHAENSASDVSRDLPLLKTLLPAGTDFAGAFRATYGTAPGYTQLTGDDYGFAVGMAYVWGDFNNDGRQDLALAVEPTPHSRADDPGYADFQQRQLLVFLASAGGQLKLAATGGHVLLNADEGGVFGDPYSGLSVSKSHALVVDHYGGSADRWGYTDTYQWRNGRFYKIGQDLNFFNDISMDGYTLSTNLLTGLQIKETQKAGTTVKTVKKHIAVKPLVSFENSYPGDVTP